MQEIAIYVLVVAAFIYLGFKFLIPKKKKGSDGKDCDKCA
jgi:hypothetical protein